MPQVPVYGDRQVRTEALRPVLQQTPDVSSGARALAQGLGQVAEVADRIDLRDSQDAAFKTEAQMREDWQLQRSKLRQQYKGDQADQYKAAADEWWNKARETYGKELNPRAQALAGRSIQQYKMAQDADTLGYVENEKTRAREINFKTLQANTSREALQNATVETAGALAATTVPQLRENAIKYAAANGLSSDVGEAMVRQDIDNFHKGMALMLATRPDGMAAAQTYITENSKDMLPADRDAVNRQIEITATQASRKREEKASDAAWQLFAQNKPISEDILKDMDGRERAQLQRDQQAKYERFLAGKPVKTDMGVYIDTREALARGEKVNLKSLTEKIAPAQMEQLLDIQTSASKVGVKQDSMLTDEARISNAIGSLGIDKTTKAGKSQAGKISDEIDRRVRAASAAKGGKDLTADEKQGIVDRVVMDKVYVDEWGTDPQKPLSLLTPDEVAKSYVKVNGKNVPVSSVPALDRRQIIRALQATGQQTTEQAIVEMYLAGKQKGAAK